MLHLPVCFVYLIESNKRQMNEETLIATFTELRKRFIRLASRYINNQDDADDALQEAFCRLWPRRDSIKSRQEVEAMATTVVKNLCIDAWRRQQNYPTVELDPEKDMEIEESTERKLETQERFRLVQQIIHSKLSPTQQLILQRREFDGEDLETIARDLQMQPTAVRMQLSRARKTIRECYQKWEKYEKL